MFLEPSDVGIVWHDEVRLVRTGFSSGVEPFVVFNVSVGKGDRAGAIVIISGGVADLSLWTGINHIDDEESVVDRIGAFIDKDKSCGWTGVVDGGEFVGVIELR